MHAILAAVLLASSPAPGREGLEPVSRPARWGIGMMLGDPFGVSLKRYLGGANAWDAYAALAYGPGIRFGADWIWILGRVAQARKLDVDVYVGLGPFLGAFQDPCGPGFIANRCNGDVYFGGRAPLGAEILFKEAPFTVGVEVAPGFGFAPGQNSPAGARAGLLLDFLVVGRYLF